MYEVYELTK